MATYQVKSGYNRTKSAPTITVRDLTRDEALALSGHAEIISTTGTLRDVKVNGKVRTWKTRPDIEVPIKYGLYEYATARWSDGFGDIAGGLVTDGARVVKRVDE